jgi:hypothetical protein
MGNPTKWEYQSEHGYAKLRGGAAKEFEKKWV